MLNQYFDNVYLINLDSAEDRLADVTKACESVGVTFQRISAIPGSTPGLPFNGEETAGWNKNAVGLSLTTVKILDDAISKGYTKIFILEDDANFTTNFHSLLNTLMQSIPEDWDFLHLNANHKTPPEPVVSCVDRITRAVCCQGYAINKHMLSIYKSRIQTLTKPIDEHTADLHEERKNSFSTSVNAIYHLPYRYSTLRETEVNY